MSSTRLAAAILACGCCAAWGQSFESDLTPESAHLAQHSSQFAVPQLVSDDALQSLQYEDAHDRFSARLGIVLLPADYTIFEQDAASRAQVGIQDDQFEVRSVRVMARGHFELFRRWNYVASYEYKGFDQTSASDWSAADLRVSTEIGPRFGTLTIGKMKEPFSYEMVGDAANLPQNERLLSPFFVSRNVGVQLSNQVLDGRATWAAGYYNDWITQGTSFADAGNDFAARFTALPLWTGDGASYLHMAVAARYYGGADNLLRFRGRPASNVADYYVDTGKVPGDHAWHTGLEALWSVRGYSLLGEYVRADLSTSDSADPTLTGWYVTGSWVLTGEHRPYDRKAGYARRILPARRWGAVELVGRYGRVDLDDGPVQGGTMAGWWTGVNWWATRRFKASAGYGNIDLERFGRDGNTQTLLLRLQWIY